MDAQLRVVIMIKMGCQVTEEVNRDKNGSLRYASCGN